MLINCSVIPAHETGSFMIVTVLDAMASPLQYMQLMIYDCTF